MANEKNTKPEKQFRSGAITASIWKNTAEVNGKETEFKTIAVNRSYKDKDDKWQNTNSFRISDLPKVQLVCQKAYEYLMLNNENDETEKTE